MWNFEDKVKTNDIEEICNLLKAYKGQWVAMVDRSGGAVEYDGSTCEDYSWCLKVEKLSIEIELPIRNGFSIFHL